MERMFRAFTLTGLVILLCFSLSGVVFAQNEDSFVRAATVSKRDAVLLSALFPGLGQMTAGSKAKGVSMFLAETVSLALFVNSHENYTTKLDNYDRDKIILDNMAKNPNGNYTEASKLFADIKSQSNKLDDLHRTRNIALIVAAGVYAYNLFDAVFLTSSSTESQRAEKLQNITVESVMVDRTPGILISKRF
jgi:hypothetical protein